MQVLGLYSFFVCLILIPLGLTNDIRHFLDKPLFILNEVLYALVLRSFTQVK